MSFSIANNKYLLVTICFLVLAFLTYTFFYDILIPGIPNGSYRYVMGNLFMIPAMVLVLSQAFIGGLIIYLGSYRVGGKGVNYQTSTAISALLTFMFSLTYVFFPMYGPFYYIVAFATGGPWYVLPVEIIWSMLMLAVGTLVLARLYRIKYWQAFLFTAVTLIFIMGAAS